METSKDNQDLSTVASDLNPRSEPVLDFKGAELGELGPADYEELGFICGLEVHQQLLTERKLFCRCPAGRRSRRVDAEILRHMRPTLSELGEYDGCALMEFKTRKDIVYQLDRDLVCTYEMDDTPPFPINEQAVRYSIEVSMLFGLNLVSELQVMRKQYLDGSIPTGFQRTAMVGVAGEIPFKESSSKARDSLRIRQLTLEEDSCREVADTGHRITFRTDRLGMPLVETVTEPELMSPFEVEAGSRLLARVVRSSGKVRRGPGAARQDVNVSIAGSRRVELKGVSTQKGLPLLVHNEAFRHLELLRIRAELQRRGLCASMFAEPASGLAWEGSANVLDVSKLFEGADQQHLRGAVARGQVVCAIRLPGFGGLLSRRTQPGIVFAQEFADRVRVIACPTARPFCLHSDQDNLGELAWRKISEALEADSEDALFLVWAAPADASTGAREILARARDALIGVPSETRQAYADGTTGFERILPGPQRMYPDTDTPPLTIPDAWIEAIELKPADSPWQRRASYEKLGLSADAATGLVDAPWADLFDTLAAKQRETRVRLAAAFEKRLTHFWRRQRSRDLPAPSRLIPLVQALDRGDVHVCGTEAILDRLLHEVELSPEAIISEHRITAKVQAQLEQRLALLTDIRSQLVGKSDASILRCAYGRSVQGLKRGSFDPHALRSKLCTSLVLDGAARP